ncbi:hypothetical protein J0695_05655 [Streptomyces beijiangensis]|uniref:DNA-directed RNA polymerase specialized sigma subunit, sigma24 family n=1 Tax=Streptomyces beijiangensis TaxID=163361 RepID=A0A939F382_9ACTN|nr:hypothetical protein [Streptomyces beijiangensis]
MEQAEAALVEHYPRLVRLAYITLPPSLGRHRRVLAAHAAVQRALPGTGAPVPAQRGPGGPGGQAGPGGPGGPGDGPRAGYAHLRLRVLTAVLAYDRRPRWWPAALPAPRALRPGLPLVYGLRLFPRSGGADELALEQALSGATATARAALVLHRLEGLEDPAVRTLLAEAGASDTGSALRTAHRLARTVADRGADGLFGSDGFDPCLVHTRPTDLLRRRQRTRLGWGAVAVAAALTAAAVTAGGEGSPAAPVPEATGAAVRTTVGARALNPSLLERAPDQEWADTSRVDYTVWPARGSRTGDKALLGRALRVWANPARTVRITATPGTPTVPPEKSPRLLYAGETDGTAVVLLHDDQRVVRYAEPADGKGGAPALDFVRTDDADVTTGAALVVSRTADSARYLLAPWIAESTTRDLLRPNTPAAELKTGDDGVTDPVARPTGTTGSGCTSWPALQLRSSSRIVEKHAFLLTDLGDLAPVHLTYTPPPGSSPPARQPREATGGPALLNWARTACELGQMRGQGVRSVNNWEYALQQLPESGGKASWVCTRADTWQGPGNVSVQLQLPDSAPVVARARNTAACSRFGQHVLAGATWRAKSGQWYLIAAGSRLVRSIEATGGVRATANGTTMAVRAGKGARAVLRAKLATGDTLAGLN